MTGHRTPLYAPLRLRPGVSRQLTLYVWAIHLLALPGLMLIPLSPWLKVCIIMLLASSLFCIHRRHIGRQSPQAIEEAIWDEQGIWHLRLASGDTLEADLFPDSFVSLTLVLLNFRAVRYHRSLILAPGALDRDTLRRLRVRLKLDYGKPGDGSEGLRIPSARRH